MTTRPNFLLTGLARLTCRSALCSALFLAGCASVAPPSGETPPAQRDDVPSAPRAADATARSGRQSMPGGTLTKVELPETPQPAAQSALSAPALSTLPASSPTTPSYPTTYEQESAPEPITPDIQTLIDRDHGHR